MSERKLRIIKDFLGSYYKSKDEFLFHCPKCKHHNKKLSLNFDKNVFKCWISIPSDNARSLKTTDHIGFKHEATMRHQFGKGKHAILKRMFKPEFEKLYRS